MFFGRGLFPRTELTIDRRDPVPLQSDDNGEGCPNARATFLFGMFLLTLRPIVSRCETYELCGGAQCCKVTGYK